MKPNLTMGYSDNTKDSGNPDTINKLLGHKVPSFKGLEPLEPTKAVPAEEIQEKGPINYDVKKDQEMKIDNHKNDSKYNDLEQREEDAYSFIENMIEDAYSEEDEYSQGSNAIVGAGIGAGIGYGAHKLQRYIDKRHQRSDVDRLNRLKERMGNDPSFIQSNKQSFIKNRMNNRAARLAHPDANRNISMAGGAVAGGVLGANYNDEGHTIEDGYSVVDGAVNAIHSTKLGASKLKRAITGKGKTADAHDAAVRRENLIKGAAGIIGQKTGYDKDQINMVGQAAAPYVSSGYNSGKKSVKKFRKRFK